MQFQFGPKYSIDDFPYDLACELFGKKITDLLWCKEKHKTSGVWEIVSVNRSTGVVTVTFKAE